jgi:hypothetical protein
MKLFVAVSGNDREDVLRRLQVAVKSTDVFDQEKCSVEELGANKTVLLQLDYQWSDEEGEAFLADLSD